MNARHLNEQHLQAEVVASRKRILFAMEHNMRNAVRYWVRQHNMFINALQAVRKARS